MKRETPTLGKKPAMGSEATIVADLLTSASANKTLSSRSNLSSQHGFQAKHKSSGILPIPDVNRSIGPTGCGSIPGGQINAERSNMQASSCSMSSQEMTKRWSRNPRRTGAQDLADSELSSETFTIFKSLVHPHVFRDLAVIATCAVCNVVFGLLILFIVHTIKLTFGVMSVLMCVTSLLTFVYETPMRPYGIAHYCVSLFLVPPAILAILLVLPDGKRYVLWAAVIMLFGQLWGIEVFRYFRSPLVLSVYKQKQWKMPSIPAKICYFLVTLILSAIPIIPILCCVDYVLLIWHQLRVEDSAIYQVLIILHMPILKLVIDIVQRKVLSKLLMMVSAATVNCTLMAVEGFTTLAVKFLVVSSTFHVGIAAGMSAQFLQTLTTGLLIRRAYNDVAKRTRGDRENELRNLRILVQCAHGDMLLQLQCVLISCITKHFVQKNEDYIAEYGTTRLTTEQLVVIAVAQIVPGFLYNYLLIAYMVRLGLDVDIYRNSVLETIGAIMMSMFFPMSVVLFFLFA